MEYRALRATDRLRNRCVFDMASRRYRFAFCTGPAQVPWFRGSVVVDVDDPKMTAEEVALLSRSNVAAYVVTAESAAQGFEAMGLEKPHHVIPQPVRLDLLDEQVAAKVGGDIRPREGLLMGHVAAWLLSRGDRGAEKPLFNVDHLLELWAAIRTRVPGSRLCLIGQPGERLRERCRGYPDVLLTGRLAPAEVISHVANFDIALYPRRVDDGVQRVKLAEYMALGVPTVAYEHRTTQDLVLAGAGVVVQTPINFVDAVAALAQDGSKRSAMAKAARIAGARFDVRAIASQYERDVLDRYLV